MKKIIILAAILVSCGPSREEIINQAHDSRKTTLIYETEHCRYYCLEEDAWRRCKITACECDSGYTGNTVTSW